MIFDLRWSATLSSVKGRFNGWCPPCQSMTSKFGSLLSTVVDILGRGNVYQVLVLRFLMLLGSCVLQLFVNIAFLPSDHPLGAYGGPIYRKLGAGRRRTGTYRS